jgi:Domain of unknown function (DUF4118)
MGRGKVSRVLASLRPSSARDLLALAAAFAGPLAVAAILLPFRSGWSNTNVALLLVVVVVAVAAIGNRLAGAVTAVWAAIWFDFFYTLPYYRFSIRSHADITTAVLLLVTGAAVSQLAARARELKVVAITDESYLALIHDTGALAAGAAPEVVAEHVRSELTGLLNLEGCRFEFGSLLSHPPRLAEDGTVKAGDSQWDVERAGMPAEAELLVFGSGQYFGRFLLASAPGSRPSVQARLVAVALAEQVGRAYSASALYRSTR